MNVIPTLQPLLYEEIVRGALREDLGRAGDLTTDALIGPATACRARLVARRPGRVAGGAVAASAFTLLDPRLAVRHPAADGSEVEAGAAVLELEGPARGILSGERVALNLLGLLCGIATLTAAFVRAVAGSGARIVCTRKTTPLLRGLEKYAVRCGGGANHRFGLDDGVLIKDNHLALVGGVAPAVRRARAAVGHMLTIEVEADTLAQVEEALAAGVDAVLLDNMDLATLREAVRLIDRRCLAEASGGIDLGTAAAVAATGVDLLSVGALTHSAPWLDLSLEVEKGGG
jgi:nicotinate-nucleotide pyrophosphorylase (carboxylating)